ncbi:LADA_0F08086g1_1 [Lachancea dasiensis]|uniref:LADA_0F08086g1_1 n=1 Tax=Lachancea dasiensis TaxID=1072105 RepID=A0A1G4JKT1_9SACH|nr:LADA_0F08086g1_1 [Lachancea dasiensis]
MFTPETPQHTGADEELNIDDINELDDTDVQGLNLDSGSESTSISTDKQQGHQKQDRGLKRSNSPELNTVQDEGFDQKADFLPRVNMGSPFSSGVDITKAKSSTQSHDNPVANQRRLSMAQQSRFISYCDDKLMNIQRKFVQSRGLAEENGYTGLAPLLEDLKTVLDFLWYSIEGVAATESLLAVDLDSLTHEQYSSTESTDFGQMHYLLRVADDFLDYLTRFNLNSLSQEEQHKVLSKAFKFLMILDKIFARSLEGLVPGNTKMTGTEVVRIAGIAERTRMVVPRFLEEQRVHGYHFEVSKIYEETLERCA